MGLCIKESQLRQFLLAFSVVVVPRRIELIKVTSFSKVVDNGLLIFRSRHRLW